MLIFNAVVLILLYPFFYFYVETTDLISTPGRLLRFWDFRIVEVFGKADATRLIRTGSGNFWLSVIAVLVIIFLRRKKLTRKELVVTYLLIYVVILLVPTITDIIFSRIFTLSLLDMRF